MFCFGFFICFNFAHKVNFKKLKDIFIKSFDFNVFLVYNSL